MAVSLDDPKVEKAQAVVRTFPDAPYDELVEMVVLGTPQVTHDEARALLDRVMRPEHDTVIDIDF